MKRILSLVDFTDASKSAVEYAANLAKRSSSELILMHILTAPKILEDGGSGLQYTPEEREERYQQKLLNYRTLIEDEFSIPCQSFVKSESSTFNSGVKEVIRKGEYNLIVMGTNGAENLRQFLFGMHSSQIIKHANIPLLIVPQDYNYKDPEQIVYGSDYESEDADVVRLLQKITHPFNPTITILHISQKPTPVSDTIYCSIKNELEDELDISHTRCERIFAKNPVSGIHEYMTKGKGDLLVLLAKKYSFLEKLVHKSTIQQINTIASYPILIVYSKIQKEHGRLISPDVVF